MGNHDQEELKLYPFQQEGVEFIHSKRGRALIADEPGLGKTVQAIAWLKSKPHLRPAVVVVPASLRMYWVEQISRWLPNERVVALSGRKVVRSAVEDKDVLVLNYEIFGVVKKRKKRRYLADDCWASVIGKELKPKILIVDEVHKIKNPRTQQSFAVKKFAERWRVPFVLGLSGTPLLSAPVELFETLRLIVPHKTPSWSYYSKRYCDPKWKPWGWDFKGAANLGELNEWLGNTLMIRRTKKDVLQQLPAKTETFVPVELDNRDDYGAVEGDMEHVVKEDKHRNNAILGKFTRLRMVCAEGKVASCISWMEEFLRSGQKLVVFAIHRTVVSQVVLHFGRRCVALTGDTPAGRRSQVVRKFQEDPKVELFVGNITAAGVGITLTAASSVAFIEFPWTPGDLEQAEDRVHRIGQDSAVNVYYFVAPNTIDVKILNTVHRKRGVFDAVVNMGEPEWGALTKAHFEKMFGKSSFRRPKK